MPRPNTKLTDDQRRLLQRAVESAQAFRESQARADEWREDAWSDVVAARKAGVPDELLCDETGFSRATLNRRYGKRSDS